MYRFFESRKESNMAGFTKKAIIDSFYKLLVKKQLNQITVKDIVTDCGVNRNSFYYYFEDIPSLLSEEIEVLCRNLIDSYTEFDSIEEWLYHVVNLAQDNKKIIHNCIAFVDPSVCEKFLSRLFTHIVTKHIEKAAAQSCVSETDREIIVRLFIYQYTGIFLDWIRRGMPEDIGEAIKRMCYLQEGSLAMMVSKSSDKTPDNNT